MRLAVLPFDDLEPYVAAAGDVEVRHWAGGAPAPGWLGATTYYVPQYLGSELTLAAMSQMPALEVVQTLTAGVDNVWPHLPSGVVLCNAHGVHDASTAELVVGLAIASLRGFPDFVRASATGGWLEERRQALADKRILLVGYGSVGAAVARRLEPFEVTVTPVARTARPGSEPYVHGIDELPTLLPHTDVLVLTVPLTADTLGLVDAKVLAAMPDGALVVNAARGPVVDTDALLAECSSGRLSAALDVTDPEPLPPDHPLWRLPNVLVTPHVGGNTSAFLPRAQRLVVEQLRRYAAGEALQHVLPAPGTRGGTS